MLWRTFQCKAGEDNGGPDGVILWQRSEGSKEWALKISEGQLFQPKGTLRAKVLRLFYALHVQGQKAYDFEAEKVEKGALGGVV